MILVTRWTTPDGEVEVTDLMPMRRPPGRHRPTGPRRQRVGADAPGAAHPLRLRDRRSRGCGRRQSERPHALIAVAGPDAHRGPRRRRCTRPTTPHRASSIVDAGRDRRPHASPGSRRTATLRRPSTSKPSLEHTRDWWTEWASGCEHEGPYRDEVVRSLLLLRALTHLRDRRHRRRRHDLAARERSAASATGTTATSGCGMRRSRSPCCSPTATTTTSTTGATGCCARSRATPATCRSCTGSPGERDLDERDHRQPPRLPGRASGADRQRRLHPVPGRRDRRGHARARPRPPRPACAETRFSWALQRALMGYLEEHWREPDHGIWEIRGEPRHFTHSRVMVWAAFDCAVRAVEEYGLDGPVERWKRDARRDPRRHRGERLRRAPRHATCSTTAAPRSTRRCCSSRRSATATADDPRMLGTVARDRGGPAARRPAAALPHRDAASTGSPPGEHPFLACSFWLVGAVRALAAGSTTPAR